MRIHAVNFVIAILAGALLTYGLTILDANVMKMTIGVGAFVFLSSTLAVAIGFDFDGARAGVNLKVVSFLFFFAGLLLNLVFALFAVSQATYVISCGILFLLYLLIAQSVFSARQ